MHLLIDMLQEGIKYASEAIKSLGRYVPRRKDIYPILMLLAEASMASKGYMILPSVAHSNDEI